MTDERFTASNGIGVEINNDTGRIAFDDTTHPNAPLWLREGELDALREYFQAEEDKRLGRWRSVEDPSWTAVERNRIVYFRNEDHERSFQIVGNGENLWAWSPDLRKVAQEWLDAHPEPKPWHDAKDGEIWALTVDGLDLVFKVGRVSFIQLHISRDENPIAQPEFTSSRITAGRRIWPAE